MNHKLSLQNNSTFITPSVKAIIKNTAKKLTGYKRRIFEAEITNEFYNGKAIKAERELNWVQFL